jgi:hypothetical protein
MSKYSLLGVLVLPGVGCRRAFLAEKGLGILCCENPVFRRQESAMVILACV